jgi:hypothetical protein
MVQGHVAAPLKMLTRRLPLSAVTLAQVSIPDLMIADKTRVPYATDWWCLER